MAEISPREFLDLLKKSGLIEAPVLKDSLKQLSAANGGAPIRLKQMTAHLVQAGLLTEWHCDKLLEGKYKGFVLGQYNLLRLLGVGGMSAVFLAEHKLGAQRRAIKVLPKQRASDKSYLDRFYQEGRAAAALNHPNIVRIYDLANDEDVHYMVMEYVEGDDLQELVKRDGPLPVPLALDYLKQAATGLKHAHERGIVHRDIKPSNLLAGPGGTLKILDLGLALMNEAEESLTLMHNDRVMGTADFLSPEQAIDSHEVDLRTDIYSLGCTLHFLLTGQPPFPDGSIAQRIAQHAVKTPPLITTLNSACPHSVAQLAMLMMSKSREDRPQTCREIIAEVRQIEAGWKVSAAAGATDLALADAALAAQEMVAEPAGASRPPAMTSGSGVASGRGKSPLPAPPLAASADNRLSADHRRTEIKAVNHKQQAAELNGRTHLPSSDVNGSGSGAATVASPLPLSTSRPPATAGKDASQVPSFDSVDAAVRKPGLEISVPPVAGSASKERGVFNAAGLAKVAGAKPQTTNGSLVVKVPELAASAVTPKLNGIEVPEASTTQRLLGRKKKLRGQSGWLIGGVIIGMFVLLLAILVVAIKMVPQ